MIHKAETPAEQSQAYKELFDGNPDNVYVHCGQHMYFPGKLGIENTSLMPPVNMDCKHCWNAYYLVFFAKLPPEMRAERLDQFEQAAHHAAEAERRGQLDFKPFRHPEIKIVSS